MDQASQAIGHCSGKLAEPPDDLVEIAHPYCFHLLAKMLE